MISMLLAGLIILLSIHTVDSSSLYVSRRSEPQLFTLPLKRLSRRDVHPEIVCDHFPAVRNIADGRFLGRVIN